MKEWLRWFLRISAVAGMSATAGLGASINPAQGPRPDSALTNEVSGQAIARAIGTATQGQSPWVSREGVVTFADSNRCLLVVQDATQAWGVYADLKRISVRPGQVVRLEASERQLRGLDLLQSNRLLSPFRLNVQGPGTMPEPRRIIPGQLLDPADVNQWSEVEGKVVFVGEQGPGWLLEVSAAGNRIWLEVLDRSNSSRLLLLNSQVRARGACPGTLNSKGETVAGVLLVPSMKEISLLHVPKNYWRDFAVMPIAGVLGGGNSSKTETVAHVRGKVLKLAGDREGMMEDKTGQIRVLFAQSLPPVSTNSVEVLGAVTQLATEKVLKGAVWREEDSARAGGGNRVDILRTLTTMEEIQNLKTNEASRNYPVRVRGVITCRILGGGDVQDATRGVFFYLQPNNIKVPQPDPPRVGDYVEIEGTTARGAFAPVIMGTNWTYLGRGEMPEPLTPAWDQIMTGSLDAQWVEVVGVVRQTTNSSLFVSMRGGLVECVVQGGITNLQHFEDAVVRIRGCVYPLFNNRRQVIRGRVYAPSLAFVTMEKPALLDPFAIPRKQTSELQQFDPQAASWSRVKVSGVIIHRRQETYFLMEETNGLRFVPKGSVHLALGDLVEVSGFPEVTETSPVLSHAVVRKVGHAELPQPLNLVIGDLLSADYDSTRVRVEARLLKTSTNRTDQVFELQIDQRMVNARLDTNLGAVASLMPGSRIELTGVCAGQAGMLTTNRYLESFELLLNSPADLRVLERPSWWTLRRTLGLVGALVTVLLVALGWIGLLRRRVEQRTIELKREIESHEHTEAQLQDKTEHLEQEIEERKRIEIEVEKIHKQLLVTSRQAGMAEVAVGVLHNVGNVLNSVNVSATLILEKVNQSKAANLSKVTALLREHAQDLGRFLTEDEKGRQLPRYLEKLDDHLSGEKQAMAAELSSLTCNIDHIKKIVAMQQQYAKVSGLVDTVAVADLVEDALRMHDAAYARHQVTVARAYAEVPPIIVDKHKVLQILVNLFHNAKYACDTARPSGKQVTVRIFGNGDRHIRIEVSDNGMGIAPENLTRIFSYGFTTRQGGHGFGLHSGALAAKELGGSLTVQSEGPGQGATFTLELPLQPSQPPLDR